MSRRAGDIKRKILHSRGQLEQLEAELKKVRKGDVDIGMLDVIAGDLLSCCRECYDYAIRDLLESVGAGPDARAYFPFYMNQIKKLPFNAGNQGREAEISEYLVSLVAKMDAQEQTPKGMTDFGILRTASDMVNEKKHDSLLKVLSIPDSEIEFVSPIGGMTITGMMEYDSNKHCLSLVHTPSIRHVSPGAEVSYTNILVFGKNEADLRRFCENYIVATEYVISEIYEIFFSFDNGFMFARYDAEAKEREKVISRVFPALTRPICISLRYSEIEVVRIDYDMRGECKSFVYHGEVMSGPEVLLVSSRLRCMIYRNAQPRAERDLRDFTINNYKKINNFDSQKRRVTEQSINGIGRLRILIDQVGIDVSADSIIVGYASYFRTDNFDEPFDGDSIVMDKLWKHLTHGVCGEIRTEYCNDSGLRIHALVEREIPEETYYFISDPVKL